MGTSSASTLKRRERKKYFQTTENSASERATETKKQNKRFSLFERYSALEPSDPTQTNCSSTTISDKSTCNFKVAYIEFIFFSKSQTSLNWTRTDF